MPRPYLGYGLGLRTDHYEHIIEHEPDVDWFEILSENYMVEGGKPKHYLKAIGEKYPLVMHGVSMSIGSTDPLNWEYLARLKALAHEVKPHWISDHLCWTGVGGINSHDLLPLPYNRETLDHVVDRVRQVQDYLDVPFLLENPSSYLSYRDSDITEWDFLSEVAERSDSCILLDVNNIYVSSRNHDFDTQEYLDAIDPDRVYQIHLAGHTDKGDHIIDTHDHDVCDPVWDLYRRTIEQMGPVSTMIERDDNIPPFETLYEELMQAKNIGDRAAREHAA